MRTMARQRRILGLILAAIVSPAVCAAQAPPELGAARSVCLRCAASRALLADPAGVAGANYGPVTLLPEAAAGAQTFSTSPGAGATRTSAPSRKSVMGWSIAAGIGAAVGLARVAASKHGSNEGGEFCARCFVQWSAVSIPVGAGIGAVTGSLIDRPRR